MTAERMSYMIGVMQASQAGQEIETSRRGDNHPRWFVQTNPEWNWLNMHYRIKPPLPPKPREWEVLPSDLLLSVRQPGEGERGWIKVREVLTEEQP